MRPVIAVEGDVDQFRRACVELRRAGWTVVPGFGPGVAAGSASRPHVVRAGSVDSERAAGRAVQAVLDGDGVVVHAVAPRGVLDLLYEDLQHVGPLVVRTAASPGEPTAALPPAHQQLLRLLLQGHTLSEAASLLSISRRTADRRVAEARRFYGVTSTAQLLRAAATSDLD